jgi:hypothetical protein
MDGKDIIEFLESSKFKFSTALLAAAGAYDLSTLRNADTKVHSLQLTHQFFRRYKPPS